MYVCMNHRFFENVKFFSCLAIYDLTDCVFSRSFFAGVASYVVVGVGVNVYIRQLPVSNLHVCNLYVDCVQCVRTSVLVCMYVAAVYACKSRLCVLYLCMCVNTYTKPFSPHFTRSIHFSRQIQQITHAHANVCARMCALFARAREQMLLQRMCMFYCLHTH